MRIQQITLRNFPPFADGTLIFPSKDTNSQSGEVHLLTGQNGTGKTRILCLIAAACGNRTELDQRIDSTDNARAVVLAHEADYSVLWSRIPNRAIWRHNARAKENVMIETLVGKNPASASADPASVPGEQSPHFGNSFNSSVSPAIALAFRGMARISDAKVLAMSSVRLGDFSQHLLFDRPPNDDQVIGQCMTNIKMAAAMEEISKNDRTPGAAMLLAKALENVVTRITGREFYFVVTPYPEVGLKFTWGGVAMWLRQLPDGLRSIIGWLVACVAKLEAMFPDNPNPLALPVILLLDEPEGHLHPAWQRKVVPAAQALLPNSQIFVATHSPFVISSVNEGWIHVFRANDAGVVTIDKARPCSKGDTFLDVVEDVLGVKEWYDPESESLLVTFRKTRDAALAGSQPDEVKVHELARQIGERSESLSDLMGREIRQFERQMDRKRAQAAAS